jgi:DnaK suppressor protein
MERSDQERYRALLLAKRDDLLNRVRRARSSETDDSEKRAADLGDRASTTQSRDLLYQLSTGERDIVKRIDNALGRLDGGSYGVCDNCGKTVQKGRLEAVPWALHCIECQELQDQGLL